MAEERFRSRVHRPPGYHAQCPECRGSGLLPGLVKQRNMGKGMGSNPGFCPRCDGVGWLADEPDEDEL